LLFGNHALSGDLAAMATSGGVGALYDSDVTLLLELPDAKREIGLSIKAGAFTKQKKSAKENEDSYFMSSASLGVADGVGGLKVALGVTSKVFADELMANCKEAAEDIGGSARAEQPSSVLCKEVLCGAFQKMESFGAATVVITHFDERTNKLGMAFLGDSGVMVVRRPTHKNFDADRRLRSTRSFVVFKSPPLQHEFNYPFQLCRLPSELAHLLIKVPDRPESCMTFDVDVEEGDLILVCSDGINDNLHDAEILDLCDHALSPYAAHVLGLPQVASPPGVVACAIGSAAYVRSRDPTAKTPFGDEARKSGWQKSWCRGGKEDDITCVAAWVVH
jgi:serine/threonine protein phosphatase PrpC